jgi:protein transport protein SEC24
MNHGQGSYQGNRYGPPPSATGSAHMGRELPPPPVGSDQSMRTAVYPPGNSSTGAPPTQFGAPTSMYGAPKPPVRGSASAHPPPIGTSSAVPPQHSPATFRSPYGPPQSSQQQQPISQAELLNRLGQPAPLSIHNPNPTNMPTAYRAYAPPPIATNNSGYGGGLDSKGSIPSNRSSGNYGAAVHQQYPTGTPSTAYPRGFASSQSSSNLHANGGSSPTSPASGSSRIDPSQMPRPDRPLLDVVFHTKSGSGRRNPPSCNSIYTAVDTGNCIPRHMRCTLVRTCALYWPCLSLRFIHDRCVFCTAGGPSRVQGSAG